MDHVDAELTDYVLDLLPPERRAVVDGHLRECRRCLDALEAERRLGAAVRGAFQAQPPLTAARASELMPVPPVGRRWRRPSLAQRRPLAAAGLVLLLALAVISWRPVATSSPAAGTTTATLTATATIAGTIPPRTAVHPGLSATPIPAETPGVQQ